MAKQKVKKPSVKEKAKFDDGKIRMEECFDLDVKLAFRRVSKTSPVYDKVICWWTKSEFFHVEVIVGDMWISSDGKHGVHIKKIDPDELGDWVIHELPKSVVTKYQYDNIIDWLSSQHRKHYDYIALLTAIVLPLQYQSQNRWFCSEITTRTLQMLGYPEVQDLEPQTVAPATLATIYNIK